MLKRSEWFSQRWLVEAFIVGNLAFLAVDIWFAHSFNDFHHWAEWIPFAFSLAAPWFLLPGLFRGTPPQGAGRVAGLTIGGLGVLVGIAGLLWHLQGTFFQEQTLHNLVYTAPFAAPLSYAGLGFLLILPRLEAMESDTYSRWVVFLAACGFAGNFALTLADHAQNGFFHPTEWIGVIGAACAFGFLLPLSWVKTSKLFMRSCWVILGIQVLVGLLGAALHFIAIWNGPAGSLLVNAIDTAPVFAPLLFVDLAILAGLGLIGCKVAPEELQTAIT